MNDSVLTPERILAAAEDVLRRYGPGKATVVDVAQALGVSHGSVYRHFASKAALREAVLRGWLARSMAPLQAIANSRRSEEHTSELQSLMRISYAVFCLKKKKKARNQ